MFLYFMGHDSRQITDRRSGKPAHFLLKESNGQLVLFDRRYTSDRRLNSISAKIACRRQPGYGHVPGVFIGSTIKPA
jgi:urease beta subunit